MDAMIQRCQTKNDNLCTEIEMYADCKQYHKDISDWLSDEYEFCNKGFNLVDTEKELELE